MAGPNEYDWQLGDLAMQGLYPDERGFQPTPTPPEKAWPVPTTGMAPWPYQPPAPAQSEAEAAQQARDAAAYQIRRPYQTAATRPPESNRLTAVAGAIGSAPQAIGNLAAIPGRTMEPNPYPPGSEEAQFYEDQRRSNTYRIAPEAAMNLAGTGTPFAVRGGLGMAGGKPPIAPGALAATSEYRPPFYSAVEQAVQGAKQNAAPGQQWAGFLRNQPGVKPEEVEALKLGKLFEQPGSVPKEAVLGEIAANRVNVGEVVKGGQSYSYDDVSALARSNPEQLKNKLTEIGTTPQDAERRVQGILNGDHYTTMNTAEYLRSYGDSSQPKFSQYTLPGGENYREMLLTLPQKKEPSGRFVVTDGSNFNMAVDSRSEAEDIIKRMGPNSNVPLKIVPDMRPAADNFKSSHFDEPNILAHVRTNDRVIDGKKTLFVEEVQSDWHQKGKREGYRLSSEQTTPMDAEYRRLVHKNADARAAGQEPLAADVTRAQELEDALIRADKSNVPDAPFKTTWPDLAMKRIIREAAEKGYDKVAWTPGEVQAARYDLSKHVDSLRYNPDTHELKGYMEGNEVIEHKVDPKGLADVIGKDAAEKLMKSPLDRAPDIGRHHSLSGHDLKVGGEGMKGFYDEILPATVNRLVKKHGGRVTQGEMQGHQYKGYKSFDVGEGPIGGPALYGVTPNGNRVLVEQNFIDGTKAWERADFLNAGGDKRAVHTLDITPSLRAAAMKGFPLFSAGGVAATGIMGEMARQDEYQ